MFASVFRTDWHAFIAGARVHSINEHAIVAGARVHTINEHAFIAGTVCMRYMSMLSMQGPC
jgi:hypothetical protein